MGNIFISYRREDTAGHSGRLFDKLREHFGKDRVFMDIAGIEPGVDFVEAIEKAVGSCDAFIVVIGKQWLSATDGDGRRRLDNPEDFIRLELATALRRNIRVIPVLVQGAAAPSSGSLPEDLKKLSRLQAHEISDNRWDYDVGTLIETLEKVLKKDIPKGLGGKDDEIPTPPPPPQKFSRWIIAIIAAIVVGIAIYMIVLPRPPVIEMPDVVGKPYEEAKVILEQKSLKVLVKGEQQTREKPPGTVVDQKPEPGTKLKKGDRVELVLATRPIIKMPNVVGRHIDEARAALEKAGLAVSEVKPTKTSKKSPGVVLNQTPEPGVEVEAKQTVRLEVAVRSDVLVPTKPIPPPKPSPPQIHSFKADPSDIQYGQSSTLRWETLNSVLLRIKDSRGWSIQFKDKSGSHKVTPTSSETYTLIAEGEGGSRLQQTVKIKVRVPCEGRAGKRTVLRSGPGAFTMEQIRSMILQRGFRENDWNPNGDFQNLYEAYEQVVVDCATGLMWQRSGSEAEEWDWQTAPNYVRRINAEKFAGFSDWRLPTIEELSSLLEPRKNNKGLYISELFDNKARFWSSDDWISTGTPVAWGAKFEYGGIWHGGAKTNRFFVRAVRSLP
jgi:hypothetical protein